MIILGIDPGTASVGFGVINKIQNLKSKTLNKFRCLDYGVIQTSPDFAAPERLKKINNELSKLIKKYQPKALTIESLFFFRNFKTAIPVSQASGVILLTAAKNNLPVYQFTPLQVKLAITGFGWSEKKIVQKRVESLLKLKEKIKSDDAADALAVALAFYLKRKKA